MITTMRPRESINMLEINCSKNALKVELDIMISWPALRVVASKIVLNMRFVRDSLVDNRYELKKLTKVWGE